MHALRKTLPTVASQETETESQTTTCVLQISIGENLSTKHELGFFFFFSFLSFAGASKLPAACEPPVPRHLSLSSGTRAPPARHLSSWSRDPSRLPSPRSRTQALVTLLQALRVCGGQGGTLIPPGPGPQRRRAPARRAGARRDASSGRPSRTPAAAAALLAHLARGRSSGPLSCSGSSSAGGGGGGGAGGAAAEAAAALRGALGGMTPCRSRSRRAVRRAGEGGLAHVGAHPRLLPTPVTKII